MIIVAITGPRMRDALAQVAASARHADAFEFRCDLMHNLDLDLLLHSTKKPRIVTFRPEWEGGRFRGGEDERLSFLNQALSAGADYVDIELGAIRQFVGSYHPDLRQVIVSHHPATMSSGRIVNLYERLHRTGAGVVKIAFPATDAWEISHAVTFLEAARLDRRKAIAIAMGEAGEASRVLYRVFGGWGTFAASEEGEGSAAGQLSARTMKTIYHAHRLTRTTRVFGLIGNPVRHSRGIYMHNAVFRRSGINAVYCNFPVVDLSKFMTTVAPRMHGFSVTVPHKEAMLGYVDEVSLRVKAIGALNTIVRRKQVWFAENTDATAALDAVEQQALVKGKRVVILGAGGTARAIAYECLRRGAVLTIANRTMRRAHGLAKEFGVSAIRPDHIRTGEFDILINATSVGMWPKVDDELLPEVNLNGTIVFDAVFNPPTTALLQHAMRDGATAVSGIEMYLQQAIEQDSLFIGKRPGTRFLREVLKRCMDGT